MPKSKLVATVSAIVFTFLPVVVIILSLTFGANPSSNPNNPPAPAPQVLFEVPGQGTLNVSLSDAGQFAFLVYRCTFYQIASFLLPTLLPNNIEQLIIIFPQLQMACRSSKHWTYPLPYLPWARFDLNHHSQTPTVVIELDAGQCYLWVTFFLLPYRAGWTGIRNATAFGPG